MQIQELRIKVLEYYGIDAQIEKTIEELEELKEALISYKSDKNNTKYIENLKEELADVENMTMQINEKINYSYREKYEIMNSKMKRQIERISQNI